MAELHIFYAGILSKMPTKMKKKDGRSQKQ